MVARDRFRLPDPAPPHSEPDLSLRGAISGLFKSLDGRTGAVIRKICGNWKVIAGENVAAHSRPGRLNENVLYVYVDNSTWLTEITRYHAGNILRKIQGEIGADVIKSVRFQVNPRECRLS